MNISQAYAVAVGGSCLIILLLSSPQVARIVKFIAFRWSKHLVYPYIINRHRFVGPWSRVGVCMQAIYIAANIVCLSLQATISEAGLTAGTLCVINTIPLFAGPHFSFLADLSGLSIAHCKKIHLSASVMSFLLALLHILIAVFTKASVSLAVSPDLFALIGSFAGDTSYSIADILQGSSVLLLILLLFVLRFRRLSYELFLRVHQALAVLFLYSTWRHLPSNELFPRAYIYMAVILFGCASLFQGGIFVCRVLRHGRSRARISQVGGAIQISIKLQTPIKIKAGQYINLWIPSVSFWSFTQSHPFVVMSWAKGRQDILELFVEPRKGLTREIMKYADKEGFMGSHPVLFSGPHGSSLSVTEYGEVVLIASGFGIAAQLPYLKHLILGYNPRIVRTRRIHLIWEVNHIVDAISAQPLLNEILNKDNKDGDCQFTISIYVKSGDIPEYSFGTRAKLYPGTAPLQDIFEMEFYGRLQKKQDPLGESQDGVELVPIQRVQLKRMRKIHFAVSGSDDQLPLHTQDKHIDSDKGEGVELQSVKASLWKRDHNMLITVSASGAIRDKLRLIVRDYLDKQVKLEELEYQPSN